MACSAVAHALSGALDDDDASSSNSARSRCQRRYRESVVEQHGTNAMMATIRRRRQVPRWLRRFFDEVFGAGRTFSLGRQRCSRAREIEIVRGDWEKVELIADTAATLLYDRVVRAGSPDPCAVPAGSRGAEGEGHPDAGGRPSRPVRLRKCCCRSSACSAASTSRSASARITTRRWRALSSGRFAWDSATRSDDENEAAWTHVYAVLTAHMQTGAHLDALARRDSRAPALSIGRSVVNAGAVRPRHSVVFLQRKVRGPCA